MSNPRKKPETDSRFTFWCPKCDAERATAVVDSRPSGPSRVRRRRQCNVCGDRITTYELTAETISATQDKRMAFVREVRAAALRFIGADPEGGES